MRANAPYVVDDAWADPRVTAADRAAYARTQIRAVVCVPLHKAGRLAAAMAVHQRGRAGGRPTRWSWW
jgi:GAF domain-containing protein